MKHEIIDIQPYLQKVARYYTKNKHEADDLVQETILKALDKKHLFQEGTNFKNWTSTILRNTFINNYRRNKKFKIIDLQEHDTSNSLVDNKGEYTMFEEEVKSVLNNLKPEHRKIIELRKEGYTYEELADKLNKPLGTIKSQIHFARKNAKKEYNKLMRI